MSVRLIAVLLAASTSGIAGDREFDHLVDAIESHYGIQRAHIPLTGVADLALKLAHPGGAGGFQLAVFSDLKSCETCFDREELDRFIAQASDGVLHPLVRVHSRGEATYILTGQIGKSTKMLIATFERSEATIVEVTVDLKTLLRTVDSPGRAGDWVE
jgi:hypothetical protein